MGEVTWEPYMGEVTWEPYMGEVTWEPYMGEVTWGSHRRRRSVWIPCLPLCDCSVVCPCLRSTRAKTGVVLCRQGLD